MVMSGQLKVALYLLTMEYKDLLQLSDDEIIEELQRVFPDFPNVENYPKTALWYVKLYEFYKKRKETYGEFR